MMTLDINLHLGRIFQQLSEAHDLEEKIIAQHIEGLIKLGWSINDKYALSPDDKPKSTLYRACQNGSMTLVQVMLRYGTNTQEYLHEALIYRERDELLPCLEGHGIPPLVRRSALLHASKAIKEKFYIVEDESRTEHYLTFRIN